MPQECTDDLKLPPGGFGAPGSGRSAASKTALAQRFPPGQPLTSHSHSGTNESGDLKKLVLNSDPLPHDYEAKVHYVSDGSSRASHVRAEDDVFGPASTTSPYGDDNRAVGSLSGLLDTTSTVLSSIGSSRSPANMARSGLDNRRNPYSALQAIIPPVGSESQSGRDGEQPSTAYNTWDARGLFASRSGPLLAPLPVSGTGSWPTSNSARQGLVSPSFHDSGMNMPSSSRSMYPSLGQQGIASRTSLADSMSASTPKVLVADRHLGRQLVPGASAPYQTGNISVSAHASSRELLGKPPTDTTLGTGLSTPRPSLSDLASKIGSVGQPQRGQGYPSVVPVGVGASKPHEGSSDALQERVPGYGKWLPQTPRSASPHYGSQGMSGAGHEDTQASKSFSPARGSRATPVQVSSSRGPSRTQGLRQVAHAARMRHPYTGEERPFIFPPSGEEQQRPENESSSSDLSSSIASLRPSAPGPMAKAELNMEDVAQNFEGLEASVVFRDNNAAHEKIGQLQAELVETQKRCGRYKTERGSLRTALASNQASLQEASRRMSELEEVNRKMASANRVLIEQLRTTQNKESGEPELRSGVVLESLDQPVILPQMQPVQREQQAQQIGQALQDGLSYLPELVTAGRLKVPLGLVSPDSQSSSPGGLQGSLVLASPGLGADPSTLAVAVPAAPSASIVVDEQHFRAAFGSLFSSVENWARRFANVPDSKSVRDLPADLRGLLREAADASLTESLLAHVETRWTMVTRVVVQYLMNQVQQYDLLKDFEKEVDEKVEACKARLHPRFPTQVRKQILEELAEIANNIKTQQHYAAFIKHKINLTSGQLYTLVGFLQAKNTRTGESRLLFDQIVHEALQLGSEMFASPVEWVIDFPKLGSKYNSHSMINRDPVMNGNPLELERRNIRVKLAITPTVIYRDVAGAALLVSTLHSGHVLLMA